MTDNSFSLDDRTGENKSGLMQKVIPLLILLLVIALSVAVFFYGHDPETVARLKSHGYLGVFLFSLVGNAGVILAAPVLPLLSAIGAVIYPVTGLFGLVLVGLVGAAGAGIGEMVGYFLGYSGRRVIGKSRLYLRLVRWMERWGIVAVFTLSMAPIFFDLVGVIAGVLRVPLWKFVLACWFGRAILYVVTITAVALGWKAFAGGRLFVSPVFVVVLTALVTIALLALALALESRTWKRGR